jgi:signal transduction histidine kinase/DNA-binding response OmpR family regulator
VLRNECINGGMHPTHFPVCASFPIMSDHASRILIISDDPNVLDLCAQVLRHADFVIRIVSSAEQSLELLCDDLFDLVLLDLQVPVPHDLTPLARIRSCDPNIPVVLLTDMAALEHVARATRMGAQGVLLKPFSTTDLRNTIVNVLQRRRALRTQNRVDALRPLVQITERLLAELDLPRLYDLIIDTVRVELKADRASLMLLDEGEKTLQIAACSGLPREVYVGKRINVTGSLAGWVARHGQPLLVNSRQCPVPELQDALKNDQLSSALCVPLMTGGRARGVLNAAKTQAAGLSFTEADRELLVLLAGQAAIAIENARLYNLAQRRADRLALLYNLSTAVTGSLDLEQIIATTLRQVSVALGIDHGYLFLAADDLPHTSQRLVQYVTLRYGSLSPLKPIDQPANQGIIGQVLADGYPRVVPAREWKATIAQRVPPWEGIVPVATAADVAADNGDDLAPFSYPLQPTPYWLCVALASERGMCGAIELLGQPGQHFGEDDIKLMTALATPVAMAIEKARLHGSVAQSEARYRTLLHHATEAVLLLDTERQRILDINRATEHLSGYDRAALLEINPNDLLPGLWEIGAKVWVEVGSGEAELLPGSVTHVNGVTPFTVSAAVPSRVANDLKEVDALLQAKDGRTIPVSISMSGVPYNGQQLLLVMVRDISERQRIAHQLLQTEKLAAVGRLSASIAHEINNPLQAIHNSLHLLNNRPLSEDKRQLYLSKAQEEVDRLIGIVQRMLDFYRPSRDGVGMRLTDMHELLDAVLALADKQLQTSHISVVRDWTVKPPLVYAIGNHLKQVYLNLILNVVESMPDGGVLTIRTYVTADAANQERQSLETTSTVGSAGQRLGPAVVIEFSDTGQGIPPDILPKIFEPFYTTRSTGTGLGLAISYSIIEQHQGDLSVSSVVGQGTTFRIRLPVAQSQPD